MDIHRLFLSLCRIEIAEQNQNGQHQGKNADGPGIQCLPGAKHQKQAGSCQTQWCHDSHIPGDHLGKFTSGLDVDTNLLRQMFPVIISKLYRCVNHRCCQHQLAEPEQNGSDKSQQRSDLFLPDFPLLSGILCSFVDSLCCHCGIFHNLPPG